MREPRTGVYPFDRDYTIARPTVQSAIPTYCSRKAMAREIISRPVLGGLHHECYRQSLGDHPIQALPNGGDDSARIPLLPGGLAQAVRAVDLR